MSSTSKVWRVKCRKIVPPLLERVHEDQLIHRSHPHFERTQQRIVLSTQESDLTVSLNRMLCCWDRCLLAQQNCNCHCELDTARLLNPFGSQKASMTEMHDQGLEQALDLNSTTFAMAEEERPVLTMRIQPYWDDMVNVSLLIEASCLSELIVSTRCFYISCFVSTLIVHSGHAMSYHESASPAIYT